LGLLRGNFGRGRESADFGRGDGDPRERTLPPQRARHADYFPASIEHRTAGIALFDGKLADEHRRVRGEFLSAPEIAVGELPRSAQRAGGHVPHRIEVKPVPDDAKRLARWRNSRGEGHRLRAGWERIELYECEVEFVARLQHGSGDEQPAVAKCGTVAEVVAAIGDERAVAEPGKEDIDLLPVRDDV